jgi:hypothetical protein
MANLKRVEDKWDLDLLRRWAAERASGFQAPNLPLIEYPTRRNYNSSWQDKYWDLMYKRGSYVNDLRELNMAQAARIMELEHTLNMLQQPQGLAASKWVRHE